MAEEPQVMSIQQRIAALKQAQTGQSAGTEASEPVLVQPTPMPIRPAAPPRPKTFTTTPIPNNNTSNHAAGSNGSAYNHSSTSNNAVPPRPVPRPSTAPAPAPAKYKTPPPLPARKPSDQQRPALPPRRPTQPSRKGSLESMASDISRSTTTSAGRTTTTSATSIDAGSGRSLPPAWGEADLPPLPPKRQPQPPPRPPLTTKKSISRLSPPRPTLPLRRKSSHSNYSTESTDSQRPRLPPRLPSRNTSDNSPSINEDEENHPPLPARRLPPPMPSDATLGKLKQSGFAAINKNFGNTNGAATEPSANGVPPPIPLASRPDLSKIQATKPRMYVPDSLAVPPTIACLKCRDFSAPDAHAAQYPRTSLPTHDLGWLARELGGPFPSLTDKARVIFTWLHHNVMYDVEALFSNRLEATTPARTLASGMAVCEGYAGLFTALATHAGMEVKTIFGHGKGYGFVDPAPGSALPPVQGGHAWNVVRIDNGQWKIIDACWGAGYLQGPGQPYVSKFDPTMFTNTNDEMGLKHFPTDPTQFYRDDGRPEISWQEYLLGNTASPLCAEQPVVFNEAEKHGIGERSYLPAAKQISVHQGGPVRFQFGLICEHWTLEYHTRAKPGLFLLMTHGVDGRKDENLLLTHFRGSGPNGGGDLWYVDVPDARMLGAPGQQLKLMVLTKLGDREDAREVTAEEYRAQVGRVATRYSGIAQWELV
ncbi:kyphoscoliosis peptidase [Aspergillus sclerotiicarbonarius CBS 121057]|uniref:Kyphoscoliosis peptidase n=1 Tax=Aspergillus sclerotiicarbonarius (strain CBS 121057 / IBT 28362) TaxID=1448318 RepID=A0A319EQ88_ASPSB|nr:kyphoscoliosis peptidase [Aspergillus sclerotiicarbonarius CBS 121057]